MMVNYMYGDTKMEEYYDDDTDTSYVGFGSTIAPAEDESFYPIEEVRIRLIELTCPHMSESMSTGLYLNFLKQLEDYVYSE